LSGFKNVDDFLSRPPAPSQLAEDVTATKATALIDFEAMADKQNCCREMQRLL
jgi:hypothetical protein